ncbi:MAG: tRNA 5-methoxyuridine(34)/uridine 5-oxyacetic acid(34) synthase CmoB [Alteromonadaceae bacterium]|nr:tRNA 5-methoxyuridine(34)/uridine 5-oxyacetic acid(34) synthase CmoB [Alteromonadaceae bacterium]
MQWFNEFYQKIAISPLSQWLETLPRDLAIWEKEALHGEFKKWCKLIDKLPNTTPSTIELQNAVAFGNAEDIDQYTQKQIEGLLRQFMPWRKGPFDVHGIHINTEWRSDWKWDRVAPHISDLTDKWVLDVGCGSGYHMWRMLGAGAHSVVGIDPTQLFLIQFQAIKHFNPTANIDLMPIGIEQMPKLQAFDTVFSMGVLYHRKSPFEFLQQLKDQLRKGGELILETLVVEGDENTVLVPGERYAQMRNVWFLPSEKAMLQWLDRAGFKQAKLVDTDVTSLDEQRSTDWMTNHSLKDFLDPNDVSKTIEGYPAPRRATFIAYK